MLKKLSADECQRYSRQISLCEIGLDGQQKIKSSSVAVIGAGGLGCAALLYLAAAGVGKIGIFDHDHVDVTNLQRQVLYRDEDVGKFKCQIAKERAALINPYNILFCEAAYVSDENAKSIIQDYDVVIDATDNSETRYIINDACLDAHKPLVYGSIHHFEGQVSVFNAMDRKGTRGPNYRTLYPIPPLADSLSSCAGSGIIPALSGIIGSIQALEAIKLIVQVDLTLSGKLLKMNAMTWQTQLYQIGLRDSSCEPPLELNLESIDEQTLFVDIREFVDHCHENVNTLWIPLSKLIANPAQLPLDKMVVLVCQKGIKSAWAAKMLRERFHLSNIYSLQGGLPKFMKMMQGSIATAENEV